VTVYVVRRLGQSLLVVLGVTLLTFVLLHLLPGTLARSIIGPRATPQQIATFDRQYGLKHPVWVQYWTYLWNLMHGQLGYSFHLNRSVTSLLASELPRDVFLGGVSLVLALLIAIPVGVTQAVKRNQLVDYVGTSVGFVLYSMPAYALGIILIQIFAVSFHVFPAEAPQSASTLGLFTDLSAWVLPVATLTLGIYAYFTRFMRSSAIETLAQDYIRTAQAKGMPEHRVLVHHVLRNSLTSVVTLVGTSVPFVITGTLIVEQVFNFPGAGLEYYNAALSNDYPVMLGITLVVALATVLGNLLADIGYVLLDPRIRLR
jgi:peptide/nickel transport system permease protein